ncbi:hypothetical protein GCM10007108_01130 [Thermogymnomonas acidicola]|uniref:Ferredoxin n=1 Tax=Thermogymnomonas acidicola TaxID=399579 RepID=A0AA37BQE7_9ARCH|nr:ferredoxin [Thermogymnomonas acidicola]GGM66712.1 hypothetical protein GCM10007108_01130 [Thermogymnomonas acidicola]
MVKYRIRIDREKCMSDAICTAICPQFFYMDDEGKAAVSREVVQESELGCVMEASKSCPAGIISVEREGQA